MKFRFVVKPLSVSLPCSLDTVFRRARLSLFIAVPQTRSYKSFMLATENISNKWSIIYKDWDLMVNQLNILFDEILNKSKNKSV
ncbi:hypothetical protein FACS189490_07040 [Clostridia bacterium]|nr:hypothetical protein FACS189490_07040 [Clostridia bacterium]